MKRIFIYEHLTGGGLLGEHVPPQSLLQEGAAMLQAVTEDFATIGCQVDLLIDARMEALAHLIKRDPAAFPGKAGVHLVNRVRQRDEIFASLAEKADWSLVIAPETDGTLCELQGRVATACGNLLGTSRRLTELASSKSATAEFLVSKGIAVPEGCRIADDGHSLCTHDLFPAILKPDDCCGAMGVQPVADHAELSRALALHRGEAVNAWRLEQHVPGIPASVSLIMGPGEDIILPPCIQHLGGDSGLEFQHSTLMTDPSLVQRANVLALQVAQAVRTIPDMRPSLGWLGLDLVLGIDAGPKNECNQGNIDFVIEINPRLTSSYVTLRKAQRSADQPNLAKLMLNAALGLCSSPGALA